MTNFIIELLVHTMKLLLALFFHFLTQGLGNIQFEKLGCLFVRRMSSIKPY